MTQTRALALPSDSMGDFDRARIWFCDLDVGLRLDRLDPSALSASERARSRRLKNELERRRFVARCAFVRRVLGNLLGVPPTVLEFCEGAHGKPQLVFPAGAGPHVALDFNLSHAENVLVLAVAFGRAVGVDIEVVRPCLVHTGVAAEHFTPEEIDWLRTLPANETSLAFYRLWTRHESLAKASGRGMASRPGTAPDSGWTLHSFALTFGESEIVGALALGDIAAVEEEAYPLAVSRAR
jgi:4'-phosphopantetheinyl transferase